MRFTPTSLATLAQEVSKVDPFGGALFVYVGRRFNVETVNSLVHDAPNAALDCLRSLTSDVAEHSCGQVFDGW